MKLLHDLFLEKFFLLCISLLEFFLHNIGEELHFLHGHWLNFLKIVHLIISCGQKLFLGELTIVNRDDQDASINTGHVEDGLMLGHSEH